MVNVRDVFFVAGQRLGRVRPEGCDSVVRVAAGQLVVNVRDVFVVGQNKFDACTNDFKEVLGGRAPADGLVW